LFEIFLIPLTIILLALYLDDSPADRIILLPDEDGTVGSVVVKSEEGQVTLEQAYASADVSQKGALSSGTETEASVRAQFGGLIDAIPPAPESFVVYFESGSGTLLTPASTTALSELQSILTTRPAPEITVIGHTDRVGKDSDNDELSLARAKTVARLIDATGVTAVHMDATGRGEREPLVSTPDDVAEPLNRRVEINIR
jgi:OOP family OmpA-OmpF porin